MAGAAGPGHEASELYWLVASFLSGGPCASAAAELAREMRLHGLMPERLDWEGNQHPLDPAAAVSVPPCARRAAPHRTNVHLVQARALPGISADTLPRLCAQRNRLAARLLPGWVGGARGALGAGGLFAPPDVVRRRPGGNAVQP